MAIEFDALSDGDSSASWSHTVSGTDTILFVAVYDHENTVTAATYNAEAMTLLLSQSVDGGTPKVKVYYKIAPASGTNTVALVGVLDTDSQAFSYKGVLQSGFPDASAGRSETGSQTTAQTITTVASGCWAFAFSRNANSETTSDTGNDITTKRTVAASSISWWDTNASVAASTVVDANFTCGASTNWGMVVASFAPAGGGATAQPISTLAFMGAG